jgi:hypothetical protein
MVYLALSIDSQNESFHFETIPFGTNAFGNKLFNLNGGKKSGTKYVLMILPEREYEMLRKTWVSHK